MAHMKYFLSSHLHPAPLVLLREGRLCIHSFSRQDVSLANSYVSKSQILILILAILLVAETLDVTELTGSVMEFA